MVYIKLLGWDITKSETAEAVEKKAALLFDETLNRPTTDYMQLAQTSGIRIPYLAPVSIQQMYDIAQYSDVVGVIRKSLKSEIFRNGYEVNENFTVKCVGCGKEFDSKAKECDKCKGTEFREPDVNEKQRLEEKFKNVNSNGQTIIDLLRQVEDDINVVDDGYIIVNFEYTFDDNGVMIKRKFSELVRGNPVFLRLIVDRKGRLGKTTDGLNVYTCPFHRELSLPQMGKCGQCGVELQRAYYVAIQLGSEDKAMIHYLKDEVLHRSNFEGSLTYGFPPILKVWNKVLALMHQDEYIKDYYGEKKPPKSLFLINTSNPNSLQKWWKWMVEMVQKHPHTPVPLPIETTAKGSRNFAQFIDLMKTLPEMQFIEVRNEFRRQIGAVWGVMPLFQADLSQSGGLNNEGLQITVTTRTALDKQVTHNEFLEDIVKIMEVKDYKAELVSPEEKDEMAEEQLTHQKIINAQAMATLGFEITMNEDDEFEYSDQPVKPPTLGGQGEENIDPLSEFGSFQGSPAKPAQPAKSIEKTEITELLKSFDKKKAEGQVTSDTEGVSNPQYDSRRNRFVRIVNNIIEDTEKEFGVNIILKEDNKLDDLLKFLEKSLFSRKFDNFTKSQSDTMKNTILDSISKRESITDIVNSLMKKLPKKTSEKELESIVRTEHQALTNKAREFSIIQSGREDGLKFKWIGPVDSRRTSTCKNIVNRSANGVSLKELKQIIKEESVKGGFDGSREFTPHYSCRHVFVRHFR